MGTRFQSDQREFKTWTKTFKNKLLANWTRHNQPQPDSVTEYRWSEDQEYVLETRTSEQPQPKPKGKIPPRQLTESEVFTYADRRPAKMVATNLVSGQVSGLRYYVSRDKPDGGRTAVCLHFAARSPDSDIIHYAEFDANGRRTVDAWDFSFRPLHAQEDQVIYDYLNQVAANGPLAVKDEYEVTEYAIQVADNGTPLEKAASFRIKKGYRTASRIVWRNTQGWIIEELDTPGGVERFRASYRYTTDDKGNWITQQRYYYTILPSTQKYGWEPERQLTFRKIAYE